MLLLQTLIWAKMTTGHALEVYTAKDGQSFITHCSLDIDIHKNEPNVLVHEKVEYYHHIPIISEYFVQSRRLSASNSIFANLLETNRLKWSAEAWHSVFLMQEHKSPYFCSLKMTARTGIVQIGEERKSVSSLRVTGHTAWARAIRLVLLSSVTIKCLKVRVIIGHWHVICSGRSCGICGIWPSLRHMLSLHSGFLK